MTIYKRFIRLVLIFFLLINFKTAFSQVEKFEALYIYNLCNYVEWPDNTIGNEFVISVVGNNKVISYLEQTVKGKKIQNKPIIVKVVNSAADANGSQIVFVPSESSDKIKSYAQTVKNALIISHSDGATDMGAGINFFMQSNKLKFDLYQGNIASKNLKISGKLKELASSVK
jgi:hypothetical protein